MQLNKLDNIVFLKDLESNIIEEAFIVLKDNVNFTKMEKEKYKKMKKIQIFILSVLYNGKFFLYNIYVRPQSQFLHAVIK